MVSDLGADPSRVLPLLWQTTERRSAGTRLSVGRIVDQAVEIADAEGLDGVTMRSVATGLSVGTMSLYTHVPGKPELYALMVDRVIGEDLHPVQAAADWREAVREIARNDRDRYRRHPWLLQLIIARPACGPNVTAKFDRDLSALVDTGLSAAEINATVLALTVFVRGAAQAEVSVEESRAAGFSDADWWQAHQPYWSRLLDPERHPTFSRMYGDIGRSNPDDDHEFAFEFGLECLLDGIDARLGRNPGSSG
ncbi:TetR/AcrR family transcriptional regulator [Microlunatus speluncae]|uniref:TetR/AcrR family transcriptional regulator n=1 Tax=Microlunatus speluncae TaxID=2594267 RepID=UPI00126675B2|nr:TetR/AcrR family transcriptional regulator [Microlunatus speluncae]